jgi:hypothetical protein
MYLGIDVHKLYAQVAVITRQRPQREKISTACLMGEPQTTGRSNYFVENGVYFDGSVSLGEYSANLAPKILQ